MKMGIIYTLNVKTVSEANSREHWAAKHRRSKAQRALALAKTLEALNGAVITSATITITRIAPKALDDDNLSRSMKAIRDGIADAIKIDDGDSRVKYKYAQEPIGKHQYSVCIEIKGDEETL